MCPYPITYLSIYPYININQGTSRYRDLEIPVIYNFTFFMCQSYKKKTEKKIM